MKPAGAQFGSHAYPRVSKASAVHVERKRTATVRECLLLELSSYLEGDRGSPIVYFFKQYIFFRILINLNHHKKLE